MPHLVQLISATLRRLSIDTYTILLLLMVLMASLFPAHGAMGVRLGQVTILAIGLLFFLHGAKLSREALLAGLTHWRLHLLVLASTFVMFPLLGLAMKPLALAIVTPELYLGILFLCALPSTVQSSIAFTVMARGNVAAAVCSASASNFVGIFLTPLLVNLLVVRGAAGGSPLDAILAIVEQLLIPFLAGQILRPRIGTWVDRHKPMLRWIDQGSILLVVYTAFSASVIEGLWQKLPAPALAGLAALCCGLLAIALLLGTFVSRRLGFSTQDQVVIVFCGSKKSLASGVPMAKVLFPHGALGAIILPLMLFHQIQLMVCAILAQRFARQADD